MDNIAIVAGAAGFIGKHLTRHLLGLGMEVVALDLAPVDLPGADVQVLDLTDRQAVLAALSGVQPRWVFNLTGQINHTIAWPEQRQLMNQHWLSMLNLVEAFDHMRPEAFVNIGSSDEYGVHPSPQKETRREKPIAPYSAAKVAATHYLQMWHRLTGFPAITARFFLIYGPEQDTRRLIPWACTTLLRGETMPASPGKQQRDFLYVQDAVEGLVALAQTPAAQGYVFNIASGIPVTVRKVLETLQAIIDRGNIDFGAYPMRDGEAMALYAKVKRIQRITGWQPQTSLEDGLQETVAYYEQ